MSPLARLWRATVVLVLAMTAGACIGSDNHDADGASGTSGPDCTGNLFLELTVGEDASATAEYQFAHVADIVVSSSGRIWVLDRAASAGNPLLRQYDSAGSYIRQVGRQGSGPGEYRAPYGLALLRDGRVAVRDAQLPGRLTLYEDGGTVDAVWKLDPPRHWVNGGVYPLQVDTAGIVWLPFNVPPRPAPDQRTFFLRMRPDGSVIDTFPLPPIPQPETEHLQIKRRLPNGGLSIRGIMIPHEPYGHWTWSPFGAFAMARGDEYRVEILPTRNSDPQDAMTADMQPQTVVVARTLPAVPIPRAERAAARRQIADSIASINVRLAVPQMPRHKPPIRGIRFSDDGRLLVAVSMPSRKENGKWTESTAFDVFDSQRQSVCKLLIPDSFQLFRMRGDHAWGVFRGNNDVESVRRYRIIWSR